MTTLWHSRDGTEVLVDLDSDARGLSGQAAAQRLHEHGANTLPQPARHGLLVRFLLHFHNVLIYVLLGSAVVTALLGHWVDTVVILAVVVLNAVIGLMQEGKAEKAMDSIRHMLAPTASVMRDGKRQKVAGESLVPGDIVLLESGDKVPADVRLLRAHGLAVQEAILTGESVPVEKAWRLLPPLRWWEIGPAWRSAVPWWQPVRARAWWSRPAPIPRLAVSAVCSSGWRPSQRRWCGRCRYFPAGSRCSSWLSQA